MAKKNETELNSGTIDQSTRPELSNATLVRRVPGFVVYESYDEDGLLLGETALPMKPMFSDEQLIEAGFLKPA